MKAEHLVTKSTFEQMDEQGRTLAYFLNENLKRFSHLFHVNHQDYNGSTLLHCCYYCQEERVRILLQLGANPLIMDNQSKTPRECMIDDCKSHYEKCIQMLSEFKIQS